MGEEGVRPGGAAAISLPSRLQLPGETAPHARQLPTPQLWPKQGLRQGMSHRTPVPHMSLFYYGKGENATFPTTATGNIYPKNNSVQNRAASEFKKKEKKEKKKKPLHEFLNPILKHKRNKSIIGCTAPSPPPPPAREHGGDIWVLLHLRICRSL